MVETAEHPLHHCMDRLEYHDEEAKEECVESHKIHLPHLVKIDVGDRRVFIETVVELVPILLIHVLWIGGDIAEEKEVEIQYAEAEHENRSNPSHWPPVPAIFFSLDKERVEAHENEHDAAQKWG